MKTTKYLTASALAVTLAAPAAAQMATPDWDADGDGQLIQDEFNTGFSAAGTFGSYDADADGLLSEEEWNAGFAEAETTWGERDYQMGAFADLDVNADGMLDEAEYNDGWFGTYDTDQSGALEESELTDIDGDMAEGGLFDI